MTTQPNLFAPWSDTATRQAELFEHNSEVGLTCDLCDRPLVRTASGFLACPAGHGKLREEMPDLTFETPGGFFDALDA